MPPSFPANNSVPEKARTLMLLSGIPAFFGLQLTPLFVETKTPELEVPAKRVVPLAANAVTEGFVRPESAAVQVAPLSVERKRPPPVPAKKVDPAEASDMSFMFAIAESGGIQVAPPSVER